MTLHLDDSFGAGDSDDDCAWCDDSDDGTPILGASDDAFAAPSQPVEQANETTIVCIEATKQLDVRSKMIERAKALLDVRTEEAEALLSHFSYDFEAAATAWFEDTRKVRETSGLIDAKTRRENSEAAMSSGGARGCGICFEDFPGDALTSVGCAHEFCDECWSGWVTSKVNDGLPVVDTRCPMCPAKVSESMIRKFLSDKDEKKFDTFLRRSFLENNAKLRPCIGVDCECAIAVEQLPSNPVSVKCNCGAEFCFSCQSEPHVPVNDCEVAKKWLEKIHSDGANSEWMLANTKGCPKCHRPILKNGGCMHMHCSQCHCSFCWLCLGPWDNGPYACARRCNKYGGDKTGDENRRKRARDSLERYMFYYERYRAHEDAGKKAEQDVERFKDSVLDILIDLQRTSKQQVVFIMDALRQVTECRKILKWTYAYAYHEFADDQSKKEFFEYIQGDMERCLELLSRMIESDIKPFLPPEPEDDEQKQKTSPPSPLTEELQDEKYQYAPEKQESLEKDFALYKARLIDTTAVLRKFTDTLVSEMAKGLLGARNIDKTD